MWKVTSRRVWADRRARQKVVENDMSPVESHVDPDHFSKEGAAS